MAANQQTNNVQRNASLRRIAIVLSSLSSDTAAKLMSTMPIEDRNELRRAVTTLADVDPLERQRALHAFTKSIQQSSTPQITTTVSNADQDEILIGRVRIDSDEKPKNHYTGGDPNFRFLAAVADDDFAAILKTELPQTIAIVLASISPTQAAALLPKFDKSMRMDTINRIGRLGEISDETLESVVAHMKQRTEKYAGSQKHTSGRRALDAILAKLPENEKADTVNPMADQTSSVNPDRQTRLPQTGMPQRRTTQADERQTSSQTAETYGSETVDEFFNSAVASVHRSASQPRLKTMNPVRSVQPVSETPALRIAPSTRIQVERPNVETMSTDAIHELLVGLEPSELCDALGKVATETASLAICGLPPHITDAALAELPRSAARDVRRQLSMVGAMELREIDAAKQRVAAIVIPPRRAETASPHAATDEAITSGAYTSAAA